MTSMIDYTELSNDLVGVANDLNGYLPESSSQRLGMYGSHAEQHPYVIGATERASTTGADFEYGKRTWGTYMPEDGYIRAIIDKYPDFKENPLTVIFYESVDTGKIGILFAHLYVHNHPLFGYKLRVTDDFANLSVGDFVKKDTPFLVSPGVSSRGRLRLGVETPTVFMSVVQGIEDGCAASRSFCERNATTAMISKTVKFGVTNYPIPVYGDKINPKIMPDIGEYVRDDGSLLVLRKSDPILNAVSTMPSRVSEIDYRFDSIIRMMDPGTKIIDIDVECNENVTQSCIPDELEDQLTKYYSARKRFHRQVVEFYLKVKKEVERECDIPRFKKFLPNETHPVNDKLTPEASTFIAHSLAKIGGTNFNKPAIHKKVYKQEKIDKWRITLTGIFTITPNVGFKITDFYGGKTVIVDVWENAWMPINAAGQRADIIKDGDSTINRMNPASTYEQYINSAKDHLRRNVLPKLSRKEQLSTVLDFVKYSSPITYDALTGEYSDDALRQEYLDECLNDNIYDIKLSGGNDATIDITRNLRDHYPAPKLPVTYRGLDGNYHTTKDKFIIGSVYTMLLEKIARDSNALSVGKRQHFGIPAKMSEADRDLLPSRITTTHTVSESEGRLYTAVYGGREVGLRNYENNSGAHIDVTTKTLLTEDKPTNPVNDRITRDVVDIGMPTKIINHQLECYGIGFIQMDDVPNSTTIPIDSWADQVTPEYVAYMKELLAEGNRHE